MAEQKPEKAKIEQIKKEYAAGKKDLTKVRGQADQLTDTLSKLTDELNQMEHEVSSYAQKHAQMMDTYATNTRRVQRDKYGRIESDCQYAFEQFIEPNDDLEADIIFEGRSTILKIDESLTSTFSDLKTHVAQLYYLSESDFYLADSNGKIYLNNLTVRPALSRVYRHRVRGPPTKIQVILREFKTYGDLLGNKKFVVAENEEERLIQKAAGSSKKEHLGLSLKTFQNTFARYKGFVVMCFFITLIALYITSMNNSNRISERYYFKRALQIPLILDLFASFPLTYFVASVSEPFPVTSDNEGLATGFFYQSARVVATHYSETTCPNITSSALEALYGNKSLVCKIGAGADRTAPFIFKAGNVSQTVNYSATPGGSTINTDYGPFATTGFVYNFNLSTNTSINNATLLGLFNFSTLRYGVLILNYAQPALNLVAQVNLYTAIYNYNVTVTNMTANVINIRPNSTSDNAIITMVLVLTGFLLLIAVCDLARIIFSKNESKDRELMLYKEKMIKKRRNEVSTIDLRKFWVFKFPIIIFILYMPTFSEFISFLSLCLVITSVTLRTNVYNSLQGFNFALDNTYFDLSVPFATLDTTIAIIDSMVLVLIMFGLINQVVGFLQGDLVYYQKVIGRVSQDYRWFTLLIFWLLFISTLSNMVVFGADEVELTNFGKTYFYQMRQTLNNFFIWETYYDPSRRPMIANSNRQIGEVNYIITNILVVVTMKYIMMSIFVALIVRMFPEVKDMVRETRKTLNSLSFKSIKSIKAFKAIGAVNPGALFKKKRQDR